MARKRILAPEFFTDAKVVSLPPLARLFFQGLWCHADRVGVLRDVPEDLHMRILPRDQTDPDALLNVIADAGLIVRYETNGERLILVKNFGRYQRPHDRERASGLAMPDDQSSIIRGSLLGSTRPNLLPAGLQKVAGNGNRYTVTGNGEEALSDSPTEVLKVPEIIAEQIEVLHTPSPAEVVFAHWVKAMKKTAGSKLDSKRRSAVEARIRDGYSIDDLKKAIDGCTKSPHNMGENDRGEKYNDLELICRDAPHVDRFMARAPKPPKPYEPYPEFSGPPRMPVRQKPVVDPNESFDMDNE